MISVHGHRSWLLLLLVAVTALSAAAQPAEVPALTTKDLFLEPKFEQLGFEAGQWAPEGSVIYYIVGRDDGSTDIVSIDLANRKEDVVVDGSGLTEPDTKQPIRIQGYEASSDGTKYLLYTDSERVWRYNTKGYYYILDLTSKRVTPLSDRELGPQMFAKFDPTGKRIGFVRNRNLFVVDVTSGKETQLTRDGAPGTIINGTSDWVYEEEFGVRDAWRWGPHGRYLAFMQFDETRTRDYWLPDNRQLYPEFKRFRYPKAGERNSEIHIGVIDVDSLKTSFFDTDTWYAGGDKHEYLSAIGWTPEIDSVSYIWTFRLNRDQNHLDLMYLNPANSTSRVVLSEQEPTYINTKNGFSDLDVTPTLTFLKDGKHFVWVSETDGWRHLYLYHVTGELVGKLTDGDWQVAEFNGVDDSTGSMYFTATIEDPTQRQLYRLPFSADSLTFGAEPERLTTEEGWHEISFSADHRFYIDRFSGPETPETVSLHAATGDQLAVLGDNSELEKRLEPYQIRPLEFLKVPGATGEELNAYMIRPRTFAPDKRYPLLMFVYGGPGSQRVRKAWLGTRRLWFQMLADNYDMIVACVDGRGTGGRGKVFESAPYKQLGVLEAQDQVAAAKWFKQQDYIDPDHVGIWGWSYGGFLTLMSMFTGDGPDTFDFGIAVTPVTTWRQYDTIYTERYMSTPEKNPEGYAISAPINHVDRMPDSQHLLLVHGDLDDNVHLQNSIQLIDALQKAHKQFRFMLYPGEDHAIRGTDQEYHLHNMMDDFIVSNIHSDHK